VFSGNAVLSSGSAGTDIAVIRGPEYSGKFTLVLPSSTRYEGEQLPAGLAGRDFETSADPVVGNLHKTLFSQPATPNLPYPSTKKHLLRPTSLPSVDANTHRPCSPPRFQPKSKVWRRGGWLPTQSSAPTLFLPRLLIRCRLAANGLRWSMPVDTSAP